jgi:hypothetical protein
VGGGVRLKILELNKIIRGNGEGGGLEIIKDRN